MQTENEQNSVQPIAVEGVPAVAVGFAKVMAILARQGVVFELPSGATMGIEDLGDPAPQIPDERSGR